MSTIAPATVSVHRFAAQPLLVRRAAVLGAGTMGSRIAAHLANAGIPSFLFDMVPTGEGVAEQAGGSRRSLELAKGEAGSILRSVAGNDGYSGQL